MATEGELQDALRGALGRSGCLDEVRARVRAEVLRAFDPAAPVGGGSEAGGGAGRRGGVRGGDRPPEGLLAEDLLREFLEWNGYRQTLSVFEAEVPPGPPQSREALERRANVLTAGADREVPLLYSLLRAAQEGAFSAPPSRR